MNLLFALVVLFKRSKIWSTNRRCPLRVGWSLPPKDQGLVQLDNFVAIHPQQAGLDQFRRVVIDRFELNIVLNGPPISPSVVSARDPYLVRYWESMLEVPQDHRGSFGSCSEVFANSLQLRYDRLGFGPHLC